MIDVDEAERRGHYLELSPVKMDDGPGWFAECYTPGSAMNRCFTFAPAYDADGLRRRWLEHVEETT